VQSAGSIRKKSSLATVSYRTKSISGDLETVNNPIHQILTSDDEDIAISVIVQSPSSVEASPIKTGSSPVLVPGYRWSLDDEYVDGLSDGSYEQYALNAYHDEDDDDLHYTKLHSVDMLNELLIKFKKTRSFRRKKKKTVQSSPVLISGRNNSAMDAIRPHNKSNSSDENEPKSSEEDGHLINKNHAALNSDEALDNVKKKKKLLRNSKLHSTSPNLRNKRAQSVLENSMNHHQTYFPVTASSSSQHIVTARPKRRETIDTSGMNISKPKSPNPPRKQLSKLSPRFQRHEFQKQTSKKKCKLHNPRSAEKLLEYLQKSKYDEVERDDNNETALHALTLSDRRDKIECLLILMVHSDFGTDNIDLPALHGHTALHLAVLKADLQLVKLFLVFGANIDAVDDQDKTPLDLLVNKESHRKFEEIVTLLQHLDAKRGKEVIILDDHKKRQSTRLFSFAIDLPELQEKIDEDHSPMNKRKPQKLSNDDELAPSIIAQKLETNLNELYTDYDLIEDTDIQLAMGFQQFELQGWKVTSSAAIKFQVQGGSRLLFLDGGGIRGLIQIEIMSYIEQRTGRKITDLFDWIIGTSTGGIVALGLVYAKKSLAELRQFYFRMKEEVFAKGGLGGFSYNTDALEEILKDILGTEMKMSHVKEPKILISAVCKETTNLQLHFFNNCFNDKFSNELVWKVARYTSAAPVYFTECDDYVDGGVLANNPSDYGLTAIQNFHRMKGCKLDIACVLSIGTGTFPAETLGNTNAGESILTLKKRAANLFTLLSKALVESEDVAINCRSRCQEQRIPFFRFCPNLDFKIDPGETNNEILIEMIIKTKYHVRNAQM
jgi:calcium-independent phospholipase A2